MAGPFRQTSPVRRALAALSFPNGKLCVVPILGLLVVLVYIAISLGQEQSAKRARCRAAGGVYLNSDYLCVTGLKEIRP